MYDIIKFAGMIDMNTEFFFYWSDRIITLNNILEIIDLYSYIYSDNYNSSSMIYFLILYNIQLMIGINYV